MDNSLLKSDQVARPRSTGLETNDFKTPVPSLRYLHELIMGGSQHAMQHVHKQPLLLSDRPQEPLQDIPA